MNSFIFDCFEVHQTHLFCAYYKDCYFSYVITKKDFTTEDVKIDSSKQYSQCSYLKGYLIFEGPNNSDLLFGLNDNNKFSYITGTFDTIQSNSSLSNQKSLTLDDFTCDINSSLIDYMVLNEGYVLIACSYQDTVTIAQHKYTEALPASTIAIYTIKIENIVKLKLSKFIETKETLFYSTTDLNSRKAILPH